MISDEAHKYQLKKIKEAFYEEIREKLASLEHEQWIKWAENMMTTEMLSEGRRARWKTLFISYEKLPEDVKDQDRKWADKIIDLLKEYEVLI